MVSRYSFSITGLSDCILMKLSHTGCNEVAVSACLTSLLEKILTEYAYMNIKTSSSDTSVQKLSGSNPNWAKTGKLSLFTQH